MCSKNSALQTFCPKPQGHWFVSGYCQYKLAYYAICNCGWVKPFVSKVGWGSLCTKHGICMIECMICILELIKANELLGPSLVFKFYFGHSLHYNTGGIKFSNLNFSSIKMIKIFAFLGLASALVLGALASSEYTHDKIVSCYWGTWSFYRWFLDV